MKERKRCKALTSATNYKERCKRPPMKGLEVCYHHGGASPRARAKSQRIKEAEIAERATATYGLPSKVEPGQALLEEVWRTAGAVSFLEARIRAMDPDALVWGKTEQSVSTRDSVRSAARKERAGLSVWVTLYQKERRHLVQVCRVAIAAGIAERQVRISEQLGAQIATVIRGVLIDIGMDEDPGALAAVRKHLQTASKEGLIN